MIPQIIHFCWFSGDKYPPLIDYCIKSWKKFLPEYEIKLWNFDVFPPEKSEWVRQAVQHKKYAFAADYIRAYALYTEGGIYLDSDVEVIKSFNPLLNRPYFFGKESHNLIEAAVMGSEKGNPLFGKILEYYKDKQFVKDDGTYDVYPLPKIMGDIILANYTLKKVYSINEYPSIETEILLFPASFFSPKSYLTGELKMNEDTYCIHHFDGSWLTGMEKLYRKVKKIFGKSFADFLSKVIKKFK